MTFVMEVRYQWRPFKNSCSCPHRERGHLGPCLDVIQDLPQFLLSPFWQRVSPHCPKTAPDSKKSDLKKKKKSSHDHRKVERLWINPCHEPRQWFRNWSLNPSLQEQRTWLCDSVTHSRPPPPTCKHLKWQRDPDRKAVLAEGVSGTGMVGVVLPLLVTTFVHPAPPPPCAPNHWGKSSLWNFLSEIGQLT